MKVSDETLKNISSIKKVEGLRQLIVEHLCCGTYKSFSQKNRDVLDEVIKKANQHKLDLKLFNKLLLSLGQKKVNIHFFQFCFQKNRLSFNELIKGISKFKMFAMLCFGNFRIAFEMLSSIKPKEMKRLLYDYHLSSSSRKKMYKKRKPQSTTLRIDSIPRDKTWMVGYISEIIFRKEFRRLNLDISSGYLKKKKGDYVRLSKRFLETQEAIKNVEKIALKNKIRYLKSDYMDVYVATSMRQPWEYEETNELVYKVFKKNTLIKTLNLRYFDPTQSKSENRIDEGLVEGLMLRRVQCTIYMVQESDTLGKDSELAATLAQGKPVIAYVPKINIKAHIKKIKNYPLNFFERRLLILKAEKIFEEEEIIEAIKKQTRIKNFRKCIKEFLKDYERYREKQPFTMDNETDSIFKRGNSNFNTICKIIAIAEHYYHEKRAKILREDHPLSLQVNLSTGVANGVLVVRSAKKCADLLYGILTNSLVFKIKEVNDVYILEEKISKSPFRVVTKNDDLTKAFWNYYFIEKN